MRAQANLLPATTVLLSAVAMAPKAMKAIAKAKPKAKAKGKAKPKAMPAAPQRRGKRQADAEAEPGPHMKQDTYT